MRGGDLSRLERVARLKADLELKKFAAFRRHVAALQGEAGRLQAALLEEYARGAGGTVADMRLAHACTRQAAAAHLAAEAELQRLSPAFEAARCAAKREFGRAEVIAAIGRKRRVEARTRAGRHAP